MNGYGYLIATVYRLARLGIDPRKGWIMTTPIIKRLGGELTGADKAKCTVTLNKWEGVVTLAIKELEPRWIADGDYTLTVQGEPTSRWKRDRDGWTRLS
jgi:hypothetical protein